MQILPVKSAFPSRAAVQNLFVYLQQKGFDQHYDTTESLLAYYKEREQALEWNRDAVYCVYKAEGEIKFFSGRNK